MMLGMEELDTLGQTAQLVGFLPYLEEAINKMDTALENKVFALLDRGELTPQLAVFAWQEKLVLRRLVRRFDQKIKTAQTLGEQYSQELAIGG